MISIVIPIYNAEKYLVRCLDSVKNQTVSNFECVMINDGSTDNSPKICSYYLMDERFKLFNQENGGPVSAVKTGIENSKGDYIMFLDADDYLDLHAVENVDAVISKCDYDVVVYDFFKQYSDITKKVSMSIDKGEIDDDICMLKICLKYGCPPARWNKVFKKEILCKVEPYLDRRVGMGDDINLVYPALYLSQKAYYIKKPLIYYCQNENSFTHVYKPEYFESCKCLYVALSAFFADKMGFADVPNRIYFNNLKTLLQSIEVMYKANKKEEMKRLLNDATVRNLLKLYQPKGGKGRLMWVLMKIKSICGLRLIARLNVKVLKRWE